MSEKTQAVLENCIIHSVNLKPTYNGTARLTGSFQQLNAEGRFQTSWIYAAYSASARNDLQVATKLQEQWELERQTSGESVTPDNDDVYVKPKPTFVVTGYFQSTMSQTDKKWYQNFIIESVKEVTV